MKQRDFTFDVMKGITILSVVLVHSNISHELYDAIVAWNMPLFFVVSGYFYSKKPVADFFRKNARQLLVPYAVTCIVMILLAGAKEYLLGIGSMRTMAIAALVGNGSGLAHSFAGYSIGAIWFLPAMFWCRTIYNVIQTQIDDALLRIGVLLGLAVSAVYVGNMVFVPTDILQGLDAMMFFFAGSLLRQHSVLEKPIKRPFWLVVLLVYVLSYHSGILSIVRSYYGFWPVNFLAAVGVTILIHTLSKRIGPNRFLVWCGQTSLLILCVHIVELTFFPMKATCDFLHVPYAWDWTFNIALTLAVTFVLTKVPVVRRLFSL